MPSNIASNLQRPRIGNSTLTTASRRHGGTPRTARVASAFRRTSSASTSRLVMVGTASTPAPTWFAGTCTTALAAERLGRRWIMAELDRHYTDVLPDRLRTGR